MIGEGKKILSLSSPDFSMPVHIGSDFCSHRISLEGTYLAWMDCSCLGMTSEHLEKELLSKAKLWINAGTMYGPEGEGFMRWNLACPRINVEEGLRRFHSYLCIR